MDAKVDDNIHALARWNVIMYRNLHGSGDMDAGVDDIGTTWRGDVYRIIVNSTQKNSQKWRAKVDDIYTLWRGGM